MMSLKSSNQRWLALLFVVIYAYPHQCEVFTSMANMENLIKTEKNLLSSLKGYIKAEEDKLKRIRLLMDRVDDSHKYINDRDILRYLGNPVNVFLMLRRVRLQWEPIESILQEETPEAKALFEIFDSELSTKEDHEGAMTALFRLQDTYRLPSNKLAKGVIPGVTDIISQELDMNEIYELGMHAYKTQNYFHAQEWMQTALDFMGNQSKVLDIDRTTLLNYLAYSEFKIIYNGTSGIETYIAFISREYFVSLGSLVIGGFKVLAMGRLGSQGDLKQAFRHTHELSKLIPEETQIRSNLEYYRAEIDKAHFTGKRDGMGIIDNEELYKIITKENPGNEIKPSNRRIHLLEYERLCRGEIRQQTRSEILRMKCWYKQSDPVLVLKPQKIERIWTDPEIFRLVDILTENETQDIIESAYPILQRAGVVNVKTGKPIITDDRVSKSAYLYPNGNNLVHKIGVRAQAITNLNIRSTVTLQVANYGIGGHYKPHYDHAQPGENIFTEYEMGNRIATILYYLSDVQAGGATVFTLGKTAVFPKKGDAVFWYNLKRNGNGNLNTLHAACPVLVGQKWVSNWWIHEYRQEFRRPCALDQNL